MSEPYQTQVEIEAEPEQVFDYFVKPELLVRWMGNHAKLEARNGGLFAVDINGVIIRGEFVRIERPHLLEIAWGEAGNEAMPPGSTRLVVRLTAVPSGTRVELTHSGLVLGEAEKHAIGWPHFLARLSLAAAGRDPGADPWASQAPNHDA